MSVASPISQSVDPSPRRWSPFELSVLDSLGFFEGEEVVLIDGIVHRREGNGQTTPRRWTRREYYEMGDRGLFQDQRVQLIDGEIVLLSPQNWPHASGLTRAEQAIRRVFGPGFWVRAQLPLNLSAESEPEPDVSVVTGEFADYTDHPMTAVLVVEVSMTTLAFDQRKKAGLYARAKIEEYWILNLVKRQVEVHQNPIDDPSSPLGARYARKTIAKAGESIAPLAAPGSRVDVSDLLF